MRTPIGAADWYRGKTVVISGARGYIGTALRLQLAAVAARIVRLSRRPLAPSAGCSDLVGDYADHELWRRALPKADIIFHLAAQTSFYEAAKDEAADFLANVAPMRALLETACREGVKPFVVFAGSSTQVGLPQRSPVDESHVDQPATVYDLHKLLSEQLLEDYVRQEKAHGTTLRLSNVFGPGPDASAADRGVLNTSIRQALRGERLTVYGKGDAVRDYVFIDDISDALLMAGHGGPALDGRHFVIGSGRGVSLLDTFRLVGARVEARTGAPVSIVSVPEPSGLLPIERRRFIADASAFRSASGWTAAIALEDGIDRTIANYSRICTTGT